MQNAARRPLEPETPRDMERIYREHASRVLAAAYRVTGRPEDAEDVLQTVFMRLVRSDQGSRLHGNPAAYLHRAAINAALDLMRARKSARTTALEGAEAHIAAPESGAAERKLASSELRDEVRNALRLLSPRAAEIFVLRYFEGYDNHEIAGMLGSSRSTVAVILHRARQRVREAIRPYVGEQS